MTFEKCVIVAFAILYFNCSYGYCFNLTKIAGTWIVANTTDPMEKDSCPFVIINETSKKTVLIYESMGTAPVELMINGSKSNQHPLTDSNNVMGNLTVYGGILPFYVVVGVKLKKDISTYLVMTGRLNLPETWNKNITALVKSMPELKMANFSPTNQHSIQCRNYLKDHVPEADSNYPVVKNEVITWSVAATTFKPSTTTPKSKNAASVTQVSSLIVLISMLLISTQ